MLLNSFIYLIFKQYKKEAEIFGASLATLLFIPLSFGQLDKATAANQDFYLTVSDLLEPKDVCQLVLALVEQTLFE